MRDTPPHRVRLGVFEIDLRAGELREGQRTIRLQEQPFQILVMLITSNGELVTREEIQKKLWPNDTVVEFDHGINAAIKKVRQALGDSAEKAQYIETVARRGYRLLVRVQRVDIDGSPASTDTEEMKRPFGAAGLVGEKVSHYRVLEVIGGGGMGLVYKAEDLKLGRQVALKFLPEELVNEPLALKRFEREARTASSLDHPNICTIHEVEEHEGHPFLVMQLLNGETLRDRLATLTAREQKLPFEEFLDIAVQICAGLEAAHQKGIIHRDIKPANIFLTTAGQVKILDFGVAKVIQAETETEAAGQQQMAAADPAGVAGSTVFHLTKAGIAMGTAQRHG